MPPIPCLFSIAAKRRRSREGCNIGIFSPLVESPLRAQIDPVKKSSDKRFGVHLVLTIVGGLLVLVSPIVGALPGPGGIFVFAAGFALMLKNSAMVKRFYARLKKRHPNKGAWVDWALRRRSARRRAKREHRERRRRERSN